MKLYIATGFEDVKSIIESFVASSSYSPAIKSATDCLKVYPKSLDATSSENLFANELPSAHSIGSPVLPLLSVTEELATRSFSNLKTKDARRSRMGRFISWSCVSDLLIGERPRRPCWKEDVNALLTMRNT